MTSPLTGTSAGETRIKIPGAAGYWQETTARYDYHQHGGHCPICGGVGWLWRGYFTCDGFCHAVALVDDGRTFLPAGKETPPC